MSATWEQALSAPCHLFPRAPVTIGAAGRCRESSQMDSHDRPVSWVPVSWSPALSLIPHTPCSFGSQTASGFPDTYTRILSGFWPDLAPHAHAHIPPTATSQTIQKNKHPHQVLLYIHVHFIHIPITVLFKSNNWHLHTLPQFIIHLRALNNNAIFSYLYLYNIYIFIYLYFHNLYL